MKPVRDPQRPSRHLSAMVLAGLLFPAGLLCGEAPSTGPANAPVVRATEGAVFEKTSFNLTVSDDLISLNAVDASVESVLNAIGHQMRFSVVSRLEGSESITIAFEGLTLGEALDRLGVSSLGVRDQRRDEARITKLFVFPKDAVPVVPVDESPPASSAQDTRPRPEPFKFEFDPLKAPKSE